MANASIRYHCCPVWQHVTCRFSCRPQFNVSLFSVHDPSTSVYILACNYRCPHTVTGTVLPGQRRFHYLHLVLINKKIWWNLFKWSNCVKDNKKALLCFNNNNNNNSNIFALAHPSSTLLHVCPYVCFPVAVFPVYLSVSRGLWRLSEEVIWHVSECVGANQTEGPL